MRVISLFFYLVLILFGIIFAALNASSVTLHLYVTSLKLPIAVLMTLMLVLGMMIGFLVFLGKYWRLKADHRRIQQQLKLKEKEIQNLRAIPLQH